MSHAKLKQGGVMTNTVNNKYPSSYLKDIENNALKRMDNTENGGNGDGKVSVDEALADLNIASLINGQNQKDAKAISVASSDILEVLTQYAGEDGIFDAQEWAEFLNGEEWNEVIEAYNSSGKKAEIEMNWVDNRGIKDGKTTKGEVKVGILNNLQDNGYHIDTTEIEALIDKYAGNDGTFTLEEYQKMKSDKKYQEFIEKYNVTPWYQKK